MSSFILFRHSSPALCLLLLALMPCPTLAERSTPKLNVDQDRDEIIGVSLKTDPAVEKFWASIKQLQSANPAELAAGRTSLQALADQEYTHAQVLLGNCLASGSYGFQKDARKATNLFRLAAERGNAFAKVSLGASYATGSGVRKDDAKAAAWLSAALATDADFSQPTAPDPTLGAISDSSGGVAGELSRDPVRESQATAHFLLGQILDRQSRTTDAQAHYVAAATAGTEGRSGLYAAAVQAALNYAFGQGGPRDLAKANEMLDRSRKLIARQQISLIHNYVSLKILDEFAVADLEEKADEVGANQLSSLQMNIATMLGDKKSKNYNAAEAVKWYELAAETGQIWAMLQLGLIHARGELGQADPVQAFRWFEKAGGGDKPKHYLGVANLAICYQNGFGVAKDPAKADALFQKHRATDIVCYLGNLGQCPPEPLTFEEVTALNETWAKKKNDPTAQYLLGLRYLNGWGVKADMEDAKKWLKKAGKARHGGALCQLGLLAEHIATRAFGYGTTAQEALKEAVSYYIEGSDAGDADATANYANMLQGGRGVAKDLDKAETYYLKCLQQQPDHARAHCNLGVLYAEKLRQVLGTVGGARIETNRALMLRHYEASVRLQFPYAALNLGTAYHDGILLPQDYQKAYQYFEQAVDWGLPGAHFNLGHMHEHGQSVPVTFTEAAYHYRLAALEGNPEALRRLINFYLTGTGVSFDMDRAIFWMQQMVKMGNLRVLPSICDILMRKQNYTEAIPLLRKLTEFEDDFLAGYAYDWLSVCYDQGLGVKPNASRSKKYAQQAIKRGNGSALNQLAIQQMKQGKLAEAIATFHRAVPNSPEAAYSLGQMYYFGTNVTQDKLKALQFIQRAADGNHVNALFFLGALTYEGEPNAPTLEQAIRYAQMAENIGHPKAGLLREKLELRRKVKEATPEEKTRARSS
ncbi:MAG: hypothetical protein Q8J74_12310 [Candidatus Didemnitutus sp.]|nr:hypothetical protein [Candidatus Didemnitutus sp.]